MTTAGINRALNRLNNQHGDGVVSQQTDNSLSLTEGRLAEIITISDQLAIHPGRENLDSRNESVIVQDFLEFRTQRRFPPVHENLTLVDYLVFLARTSGTRGLSGRLDRIIIEDSVNFVIPDRPGPVGAAQYLVDAEITPNKALVIEKNSGDKITFGPFTDGETPTIYLKSAEPADKTLTLTDQDDNEIDFTPGSVVRILDKDDFTALVLKDKQTFYAIPGE